VTQGTAGATNPFVLAGGADFRRNTNRFDFHAIRATAAFRF
jgi:outer membrane immunogenic protein